MTLPASISPAPPRVASSRPLAPQPGPDTTRAEPARSERSGDRLRVAIVGAGKMAQHHARAIARSKLPADIVAIADPQAATAEAMRELAPRALVFAGLTELLAATSVDVVHIVTPPTTHAALAEEALVAGCHAYIEKPIVPTVQEMTRLLQLASDRGLVICAGHQLLFEPPARKLFELLPAVGHLSHVDSYFSFRTVRRTPGGRAPLRPDLQLLDILPHPVYLLLQVLEAATDGETALASLEVGSGGTIHALIRRGDLTGSLTVTLQGRPIESVLRIVGANGSVTADFVRSTVQRSIGPGTSGIDKVLAPYQLAAQLVTGTTAAMTRRIAKKQLTYPGLAELFGAFYSAIQGKSPPPMSPQSMTATVRVWEEVARGLDDLDAQVRGDAVAPSSGPGVLVTGGTGFLGRATVAAARRAGVPVTALARRLPASWDREPATRYLAGDLARPDTLVGVFDGATAVIHCAAETAGGWAEHQANSIDAATNALRAAAAAGVRRFIHVSSMAVLPPARGHERTSEATAVYADSRAAGPYVWGKLESERAVTTLGHELGVTTKIVRPGALVDFEQFDPPGRLGRRLGNTFVAVGGPGDTIGVVDVKFAGEALVWMALHFDDAPDVLHLLAPRLPTRRDLLHRLRRTNPDLRTVWLPTLLVVPLAWATMLAQRVLRPGRPAINVARAFAGQRLDTSRIGALVPQIGALNTPG